MNLSTANDKIKYLSNHEIVEVIDELLTDQTIEENSILKELVESLNSDEDKFYLNISALRYLLLKELNERFSKFI